MAMSLLASVGAYTLSGFAVGYALGAAQDWVEQGHKKSPHTPFSFLGFRIATMPPQMDSLSTPAAEPSAATPASPPPPTEAECGEFAVVLPPKVDPDEAAAVRERFGRQCEALARLGVPSRSEVRCYGGFLASLNYERRIPNWVMEEVKPAPGGRHWFSRATSANAEAGANDEGIAALLEETTAPAGDEENNNNSDKSNKSSAASRKKSGFYADDTVPAAFRVKPTDYDTHHYDRGHLAAAAQHKDSRAEMDATFSMNANVVPQETTVNRGDWYRLECLTRQMGKELNVDGKHRRLYVVSGPAFQPSWIAPYVSPYNGSAVRFTTNAAQDAHAARPVVLYDLTGPEKDLTTPGKAVAVPTHLYKVLLSEETRGTESHYAAAAFLLPNKPILEEQPLSNFQVPLERLEKITGLQFFNKILHTEETKANAAGGGHSVEDLCKRCKCDVPTPPLFQVYRQVAQLRAADSIPDLNRAYTKIKAAQEADGKGEMDKRVLRELEKRREQLAEMAVQPIDSI